jgi:hypothetical protein
VFLADDTTPSGVRSLPTGRRPTSASPTATSETSNAAPTIPTSRQTRLFENQPARNPQTLRTLAAAPPNSIPQFGAPDDASNASHRIGDRQLTDADLSALPPHRDVCLYHADAFLRTVRW